MINGGKTRLTVHLCVSGGILWRNAVTAPHFRSAALFQSKSIAEANRY